MTIINLVTHINAASKKCFDLSLSIDLHKESTAQTNEQVVKGKQTGLCELNDEITWEATHFGIRQQLTVRITKMDRPHFFEDTMLKGTFKSMRHEHHFAEENGQTVMRDMFIYETPYGAFGKLFDTFILKKYMTRLLQKRNRMIKDLAEQLP
ncbi:SRPBCC family protein [Chitinophagaceae bacterium MMS25-I14]